MILSADLASAHTPEVRRRPNSQLCPSPTQTQGGTWHQSLGTALLSVCQFPPPPPLFLINSAAACLCSSAKTASQHPGMCLPAGWR